MKEFSLIRTFLLKNSEVQKELKLSKEEVAYLNKPQ
jgi:hypothetical protein